MSALKDMWIAETEREASRLEDLGFSREKAFDAACSKDYTEQIREHYLDAADNLRKERKENGPI